MLLNIQNQISVLSAVCMLVSQYNPLAAGQIKAEIYHHCR